MATVYEIVQGLSQAAANAYDGAMTESSVKLTKEGEIDIRVENSSRVRSWVTAVIEYKVGGMEEAAIVGEATEDKLASGWEAFMKQGGLGKRPPNDKRPKNSGKKE